LPGSSGDKLCPICDSPIQPGAKKCGFCGTDQSIFDVVTETEAAEEAPVTRKPSLEEKVREVMTPPAAKEPVATPAPSPKLAPEPTTDIPTALPAEAAAPVTEEEPAEAEKPEPVAEAPVEEPVVSAEPETPAAAEHFECPECGTKVNVDAKSCPGCGGMFADEGTEMFQCPACNSLVNVDASTCPGCGAMFVESEEAAAAEPGPAEEAEPPVSEVVVEEPVTSPIMMEEPEPVREEAAFEPPEDRELEREDTGKKLKSAFGWLKRKKKDEPEAEEPETPSMTIAAQEPARVEPPRRIPEPELVRPEPVLTRIPERRPEPSPEVKDKGKNLARMVAEMKPLLSLAMERDIDIAESKQLIDDAAAAGRNRQLDNAIALVKKARTILMGKVSEHLASTVIQLNEEVKVARELGGDVARAITYVNEIEKARRADDVEAAFVYAEKACNELLPITGRYNESKKKLASLKSLISDCEMLLLDTKSARATIVESTKAFDARDFDKVDTLVKQASERLNREIPERLAEEIRNARDQLVEAKMKNVNISPMITILKSVTNLAKAKDYSHALAELREFKELVKKSM